MRPAGPLRGPHPGGGGFAAADLPGRRAGYGAAPPASRLLRIALRATALRAGPDPGDHCGPLGRKRGQAQACPTRRAALGEVSLPGQPGVARQPGTTSQDHHIGSVHGSRGIPIARRLTDTGADHPSPSAHLRREQHDHRSTRAQGSTDRKSCRQRRSPRVIRHSVLPAPIDALMFVKGSWVRPGGW